MNQINFIRGWIGEKISLGAQFGLNWEDCNFKRPNLIFFQVDWFNSRVELQQNQKFGVN
jgi:hypothetical protein